MSEPAIGVECIGVSARVTEWLMEWALACGSASDEGVSM